MKKNGSHVELEGHTLHADLLKKTTGIPLPDQDHTIAYQLKNQSSDAVIHQLASAINAQHPSKRKYLTPEVFLKQHGPSEESREKVCAWARNNGLEVKHDGTDGNLIHVRGRLNRFMDLHRVELEQYEYNGHHFMGHRQTVSVPIEVADAIAGVHGLNDAEFAFKRENPHPMEMETETEKSWTNVTAPVMAQLYNFPSGDGNGQKIAIYETSLNMTPSNITTYFNVVLKVAEPTIKYRYNNQFTQPTAGNDSGEAMLDIEVAAAAAGGAEFCMIAHSKGMYAGLYDAIYNYKADVISISYGWPEYTVMGTSFANAMKTLTNAAAALGITICVASGDSGAAGSGEWTSTRVNNVAFPGSLPTVLACGGTYSEITGDVASPVLNGNAVWNNNNSTKVRGATGGGVSLVYTAPAWQKQATLPATVNADPVIHGQGRCLPDVAANGDPGSGYYIYYNNAFHVTGGTSAAAPLWAALMAILNQNLGYNLGFVNQLFYDLQIQSSSPPFHQVSDGNNGNSYQDKPAVYYARKNENYNACCGLGVPDGKALLSGIKNS